MIYKSKRNIGLVTIFILSSTLFMSSCSNSSKPISLIEANTIFDTEKLYNLDYNSFTKELNALELTVSSSEDKTSVKYYFLQKDYAYNLSCSLDDTLPNIKMFFDYKTWNKADLNNDNLLKNDNFKSFIKSYLDLKAKYRIADGSSKYADNKFINAQWDIAKAELNGAIKDFALYHIIEHQIVVMGHEFSDEMMTYFQSNCTNEDYKHEIDSLNTNLNNLKAETEEHIFKVVGNDTLSAYVYYPDNREKAMPCILILHGGGWYIGHPLTRTHIPKHFNELGVVAIAVEHRIKGRQDASPVEGVKDTKSAIRWARANADKLGIDPDKIIVSGLSSGATLAALAAQTEGYENEGENLNISSKPNAVILWSGCVDASFQGWFRYCLNGKDDSKNLSPTHLVEPGIVPFMVFQGKLDKYNSYKTHVEFCDKMETAGNSCKLVLYENTKHLEVYETDMMPEYKEFISNVFGK